LVIVWLQPVQLKMTYNVSSDTPKSFTSYTQSTIYTSYYVDKCVWMFWLKKTMCTWPGQKSRLLLPLLSQNQFERCEHHNCATPVQDTYHREQQHQWQWLQ